MIFFTVLIIIAQLIVAVFLISLIVKCNKKINKLTKYTEKSRVKLIWRLRILSDITGGLIEVAPHLTKKATKTLFKLVKANLSEAALYSVLLFLKPKYKKLIGIIKLITVITQRVKRRHA